MWVKLLAVDGKHATIDPTPPDVLSVFLHGFVMRIELYQEVALMRDLPGNNLRLGDVAMLLDYLPHPHGGEEGAVLEVFNAVGESIDVVTVPASAVAPLRADQMPAVRMLLQSHLP